MANHLILRLEEDSDGTAELIVEAASGPYAGASSAWFNIEHLQELGAQLQSTFPIPSDGPIKLEGGLWNSTNPATLYQRHIGLCFYPANSAGKVGIKVHLATPIYDGQTPDSQSTASFELSTEYESLRRFGAAIVSLARGETETAELECHVG